MRCHIRQEHSRFFPLFHSYLCRLLTRTHRDRCDLSLSLSLSLSPSLARSPFCVCVCVFVSRPEFDGGRKKAIYKHEHIRERNT